MAVEVTDARSRRTLLTAAAAAAAALVAQALGRATPVRAEGQTMHVGGEWYDATSLTYIANNTNAVTVFGAQSTKGGIGLSGASDSNDGVVGTGGGFAYGVHGIGTGDYGIGVKGEGRNVGMVAHGLGGGTGLIGYSDAGVGVSAQSSGTALSVEGRAHFQRAGIASVDVGARTKQVHPGDLTAESQIHCTLDTNQSGLSLVSIKKNYQAGAVDNFRITLSATVASGKYASVSWIIFEG